MQAFIATIVDSPSLGKLSIRHDQFLVVDQNGFIIHLDNASSETSKTLLGELSQVPIIIPKGSFLLPTFCDLHLHAPQFLYQGNGLHLPLMQWLDEYAFKAEEKLDADPTLARKVYQRLSERLIENGTGMVVLFGTLRSQTNMILAQVMQEAGVRAFIGKLSMDISSRPTYVETSAKESLAAAESFAQECRQLVADLPTHQRFVEPILTPRFIPTCSDQLLAGLGVLSQKSDLRVQSHMSEAADQIAWVRKTRGSDDIHIFDKNNLLTERTLQAHCTFLQDDTLSFMQKRGSSIAHCPLSNSYFSTKPFPLREALDNGVQVGLGTDIAGGYSTDIMNAMRQAVIVSRMREGDRTIRNDPNDASATNLAIDWKDTLFLATKGAATAMNLILGEFKVGASFDAQQISLFDSETFQGIGGLDFFEDDLSEWKLTETVLEKWWCIGDVRNRSGVWTQGKKRL